MADISKYLEDILSAIYGEEVRHSIHDAIAAIDNEVYTGVEDAKAEVAKAAAQAANAAASAQSAATSASTASQAATRAGASVTSAANEANRAKTEADKAAGSASSASSSASKAAASATLSQSWATGDTNSRAGEESNNSKYYAEQAKKALSAISGSLVPMGTITFEQLPTAPLQPGVMYNISNEFTTDDRFNEGAGHKYGAGTNVYWTGESKWDCLAAPGGIDENAFIPRGNINKNWRPSKPGVYTFGSLDMEEEGAPKELSYKWGMLLVFYSGPDTITHLAIPHKYEACFAFRQQWQWTEDLTEWRYVGGSGATISPYIGTPLPPATTGSPGTAKEYARGDHVHPMQEGIAKRNDIPDSSDLNDFKAVGLYVCATTAGARTILNAPSQYAFTLVVIPSGINRSAVIQLFWAYTYFNIYYRLYNGDSWEEWHTISNISDIAADNFSGILPVEKGGTGSSTGLFVHRVSGSNTVAYGRSLVQEKFSEYQPNAYADIGVYSGSEPRIQAYIGVGDDPYSVYNNIAINQYADGTIIGTYKYHEIATLEDYATTSKAGLVKPGAGLQVSDDGTLSVTGSSGYYHIHIIYGVKWTSNYQMLICTGVDTITGDVTDFPVTALATVTSNYIANSTQSSIGTLYGLLNISISYSFGFTVNFQIQTTDRTDSISTAAGVFNLFKSIYPENFQVSATGYWLQSN